MLFSVWPSYDRSWSETVSLATWAEQHDFHSFWYADHFMSPGEDGGRDITFEGEDGPWQTRLMQI